MSAQFKRCRLCETEKPLTGEFFHKDSASGDGFKHACKQCRSEIETKQKEEIVDDAFERLQQKGMQQLLKVAEGGSAVPHSAELLQCIMSGFGGPRQFSQHLLALYFHPNTSQIVKSKLLLAVINLTNKVSDSGMVKRDLESMSTESLKQLLQERMRDAVRERMNELRVVPPLLPMPGGEHERAAG